ncbi:MULTISPECIES: hypothetical protein [unclassified Pseudoalteromonas]|uniref:hypothetical protein n=1 Tax=unclassified Pseudoalteromonas TaxID=194690 RepID=UPI001B3A430C|nr:MULTISPECIES: hypothetical protein [unclassified Pseudoalteromonas]MBQ4844729.1 hypothetical protein [Pseudoalteromonas sp. MMG005]MBQ4850854.1 hypothetical protein [Pseudoalteromonas sp. MMG012]
MNFNSLPPQAYSNLDINTLTNPSTKTAQDGSTKDTQATDTNKKSVSTATEAEKSQGESDKVTDQSKKADISDQEKIVGNIRILQARIGEVRADKTLSKDEQTAQVAKLKEQLDEQLQNVQLVIKKQTSTLVQSLFASNGSSHSGMIFNNRA